MLYVNGVMTMKKIDILIIFILIINIIFLCNFGIPSKRYAVKCMSSIPSYGEVYKVSNIRCNIFTNTYYSKVLAEDGKTHSYKFIFSKDGKTVSVFDIETGKKLG